MNELNVDIRPDTLKQVMHEYIDNVNTDITLYKSSAKMTQHWVHDTISKHIELLDIMETHNISLDKGYEKKFHSNLNHLRVQLDVGDSNVSP